MSGLDFTVGHAALAATDPTELARGGETCPGSFHDQFALHLGKAGHNVEEEAARGCLGVYAVRQTAKVHLAGLERVHEIHQPFHAPPQAIQLPDDYGVTGTQLRKGIIKARANQPTPTYLDREDSITTKLFKRIELKGEILIVRRNAGISDWHTEGAAFLCGSTRWHRYS